MTSPTLIAAQVERDAAKLRFHATLETIQQRLSPATLRQDAIDGVRETAVTAARQGADTVRRHPGKIAAGVGLLGLFLARGPITRAIRGDATDAGTDELPESTS